MKSKLIATATELNIRVSLPHNKSTLNKRNEKDSISLTMTHRPHAWPVHQLLSKSFRRFSSNEHINTHFYLYMCMYNILSCVVFLLYVKKLIININYHQIATTHAHPFSVTNVQELHSTLGNAFRARIRNQRLLHFRLGTHAFWMFGVIKPSSREVLLSFAA